MFLDPDKNIEKHRANLPHWQQGETWQFVTWRLADSLPKPIVDKLEKERLKWLTEHPEPWDEQTQKEHNRLFTLRFESLLDDCHGSCVFREPALSQMVDDALHHFQGDRYRLDSFVVMPNHVHVLFEPLNGHLIENILHSWKRHTAREINKFLDQSGTVCQGEYWDRLIRSYKHFTWARNYIAKNPTKLPADTYHLRQYGEGV